MPGSNGPEELPEEAEEVVDLLAEGDQEVEGLVEADSQEAFLVEVSCKVEVPLVLEVEAYGASFPEVDLQVEDPGSAVVEDPASSEVDRS